MLKRVIKKLARMWWPATRRGFQLISLAPPRYCCPSIQCSKCSTTMFDDVISRKNYGQVSTIIEASIGHSMIFISERIPGMFFIGKDFVWNVEDRCWELLRTKTPWIWFYLLPWWFILGKNCHVIERYDRIHLRQPQINPTKSRRIKHVKIIGPRSSLSAVYTQITKRIYTFDNRGAELVEPVMSRVPSRTNSSRYHRV